MSVFQRTLLGLALAGIAATVQGAPVLDAKVKVRFDDPIYSGVPAPATDDVKISFPKKHGKEHDRVAATRFQGTVLSYSGVDPGIFEAGLEDLYMYSYEVYDKIDDDKTANYTINFGGAAARTLDFLGAVNSVLSGGGDLDPYAWLHPTSGAIAAAIQLGIWESLYDSGAWDIASGSFSATGLEDATATALGGFFGAIGSFDALEIKYTMTLEANGKQDMITGDPPTAAAIPEPGTLALFALAAIGLVSTRRRTAS